jgi:hypothetical protein
VQAAKHGINLMGMPFLPLPSDPRLQELLSTQAELRERAIVTLHKEAEIAARRAGEVTRAKL